MVAHVLFIDIEDCVTKCVSIKIDFCAIKCVIDLYMALCEKHTLFIMKRLLVMIDQLM